MKAYEFEETARQYVDAVQYFTSGEHDRATELYAEAVKADVDMAQADHDMAQAHKTRRLDEYCVAHEQQREAFEDGRDATTALRALINNARARDAGHPGAAQ